jgi:xanthine dehydrogenase YagS FAD-binding subunit
MKPFSYRRVTAVADALRALGDGALPLAGGTDLLTLMKADVAAPGVLVDIKRIRDLDGGIRVTDDGVDIGALTSLAALERDRMLAARYPALVQAVADAATPQLRNMATIAGNLLQQPRCWYFRHRDVDCWRKGGSGCPARDGQNRLHALFGDGPCFAVHPSDPAVALLALAARARLRSPRGHREIPLDQLFEQPTERARSEARIAPDELVEALHLPASSGPSVYLKAMDRKAWAFALVSVAAQATVTDGRIERARIVLGGVAPIPWRVPAAEQALVAGMPPARVAEQALAGAHPLTQNGYKVPLARTLVQRAAESLLASAH